ncbi:MAG: nucleotide-binding protein-like protein containing TIR-like domain [Paenibacillus sp.]|nr:nucleotide-binding protein-like protein containing TIR-like domain [Paenibacillus sp.]
MGKPRVFIGSARESIPLVTAIHQQLSYYTEVTPWSAGAFNANKYPMEDLEEQLGNNDFAVFVFSADDIVYMREQIYLSPRDNTVFEMGMFWGRLRRERVFFLVPNLIPLHKNSINIDEFHIPSDLSGLTLLKYEIRSDKNYAAAVNVACAEIIRRIEELGLFQDPGKQLDAARIEMTRKQQILHFFIEFIDMQKLTETNKYEKLYEAFRSAYDPSALNGFRVRGVSVWSVEGTDGLRHVAGNVGKGRFYTLGANDSKQSGEQRIGVLDAYLNSKVQFFLYRQHVAYEYLLCYPVDKKLVLTVHLTGPAMVTEDDLNRMYEDNQDLMGTINYLFGGDSA